MMYSEIKDLCTLKDYKETDMARYEVWTDGDLFYICLWFNSNETEVPSTIYEQGSNYTTKLI